MKKVILLLMLTASLFTSCSSDDDSPQVQLETSTFKITLKGVIDGNQTNYPDPTDNTMRVTYILDEATTSADYTEALTNEALFERSNEVDASTVVGLKISSVTEDTFLTYIHVKIENLDTNEVVYDEDLDNTVVYSANGENQSTEISVIHNINDGTTTVLD